MNWLNKKLINQQLRKNKLKSIHVCNECGNTDQVTRRLSNLYLGGFVIIGVGVGLWLNFFLGLLATLLCIVIAVQTAKPLCKKCFSTNVRLASIAEIQAYREEMSAAKEQVEQQLPITESGCTCDKNCDKKDMCGENHE